MGGRASVLASDDQQISNNKNLNSTKSPAVPLSRHSTRSSPQTKKQSPFQKSMSFSMGGANNSPQMLPPPMTSVEVVLAAKVDNDQETLISLFGNLYKLNASNGSLEQICPDTTAKIFLITPMDEEPDTTTKKTNGTIKWRTYLSEEPEELSDVDGQSTPRKSQCSPVPSIDISKPENIHNAERWISSQSIKYAPQIHSERGSLISSQKASLYESPHQSASRSLSRTNNPAQAQAVVAAIEAANARRATLKKDNTFHSGQNDTGSGSPRASANIRKASTVYQTKNIAVQKSKRREELEAEFDNWANETGVDPDTFKNADGSLPFQSIQEVKEQSTVSINLLGVQADT